MITERTLRQWRKDALKSIHNVGVAKQNVKPEQLSISILIEAELNNRILRLTQELMDIHLQRKE